MKRAATVLARLVLALTLTPLGLAAEEPAAPTKYPLDTCVVSGEKLGAHGEPYVLQHEGREVRFCCKMCTKDFKKDPAKYLKMLDEAAAKPVEPPATDRTGGDGHDAHHDAIGQVPGSP